MSRQSAESRAAASLRSGGAPPPPPKHLSKAEAAVWVEIAASKPPDFFDAGARPLLERYCIATIHARALDRRISKLIKAAAWKEIQEWEKRRALVDTTMATLATKLRLSIQALVDRRSRGLLEGGQQGDGNKPDPLLGGRAVWGEGGKPAKPN